MGTGWVAGQTSRTKLLLWECKRGRICVRLYACWSKEGEKILLMSVLRRTGPCMNGWFYPVGNAWRLIEVVREVGEVAYGVSRCLVLGIFVDADPRVQKALEVLLANGKRWVIDEDGPGAPYWRDVRETCKG